MSDLDPEQLREALTSAKQIEAALRELFARGHQSPREGTRPAADTEAAQEATIAMIVDALAHSGVGARPEPGTRPGQQPLAY